MVMWILRMSSFYPGIRVVNAADFGNQPSCTLSTSGHPGVWQLSDAGATSCVQPFLHELPVHWFEGTILLPSVSIDYYQVGILTSPHVQCDHPGIVVLNNPGSWNGEHSTLRECVREPRYDGFRSDEPQIRRCAFQCLNQAPADTEVNVAVQLLWVPWLYDGIHYHDITICGIEAYTFWSNKSRWKFHCELLSSDGKIRKIMLME